MVKRPSFDRRSVLRGVGGAAVSGVAAFAGCLGGGDKIEGAEPWQTDELAEVPAEDHPALYEPSETEQDSTETLAHLTWTGYDAENVQGPFREKFNANTNIDLFTDNAQAFNRLQSGEWQQFEQCTFDMAWVPRLAEAELIRPIDYESWKPYTFDQYIDLFQPENGYKYAFVNEDEYTFDADGTLYTFPQRFGWASFAVNTDTVAESDYQSYDIAWSDKYDIGVYDLMFWGIQVIMLREGIDPFKEHTDEEIEQVRQATFDLFDNASTILTDFASMNQALTSGEIDIGFISGNWINGSLRRDGNYEFKAVVPEEGSIIWVESTSFVKGSQPNISDNYMAYMMRGENALELSWPDSGGTNVVPHQTAWENYSDEQRRVLRIDEIDDIIEQSVFYEGVPDLDKFEPIWREAKTRM
ncbi:ABC transporter substrate-binding protein [Natronorubrum thiooxidans]|uniref:Spermidine/putrescine transport system substrate-binding protein n=1 Tax=Natronorubrum thiooxidans TaxID=308853 RepID=A0A1N7H2X1_9EURY|nr:PotD/PotF family extracellular solute-binding protein [Natronorubrum thiooxidans]SIS19179.1 spermidine/putrescine transport system substrate-binding protein [Natronorubrum thiooxidans]